MSYCLQTDVGLSYLFMFFLLFLPSFFLILELVSYTIFVFYLFFCFWLPSRLHDALASILCSLSHNNLCHSVFSPLFIFCSPSLCYPITLFHLSYYLFCLLSSNSLPLCSVSIFIISTSIHYSLPPHFNFDSLPSRPLWLCESFFYIPTPFTILIWAL